MRVRDIVGGVGIVFTLLSFPGQIGARPAPVRTTQAPDGGPTGAERRPAKLYSRMTRYLRAQNMTGLQREFPYPVTLAFTQKQRNAVALLAAEAPAIPDCPQNITPDAWNDYIHKTWENHTAPLLFDRKYYAVELLCGLGEYFAVTEPRVIPYLILALRHPDIDRIAQPAHTALCYLTQHWTGNRYWSQRRYDWATQEEIIV